jgi:predicted transcriptional regulator
MDTPVMVAMIFTAILLFAGAATLLIYGDRKSIKVWIAAISLLSMAGLIAYGLDTQCQNIAVYAKC